MCVRVHVGETRYMYNKHCVENVVIVDSGVKSTVQSKVAKLKRHRQNPQSERSPSLPYTLPHKTAPIARIRFSNNNSAPCFSSAPTTLSFTEAQPNGIIIRFFLKNQLISTTTSIEFRDSKTTGPGILDPGPRPVSLSKFVLTQTAVFIFESSTFIIHRQIRCDSIFTYYR